MAEADTPNLLTTLACAVWLPSVKAVTAEAAMVSVNALAPPVPATTVAVRKVPSISMVTTEPISAFVVPVSTTPDVLSLLLMYVSTDTGSSVMVGTVV